MAVKANRHCLTHQTSSKFLLESYKLTRNSYIIVGQPQAPSAVTPSVSRGVGERSVKSAKSRAVSESVRRRVFLKDIPDVLLPSQFFEFVGARTLSSEQRLMLAVLIDAINVLGVSPNRGKSNSFNDASSWVFAKGVKSPLSFECV